MRHVITGITEGSVAEKQGLLVDDVLLQINGEEVEDEIDYQALTSTEKVRLIIERNGKKKKLVIYKEDWQPLGLKFAETMVLKPRPCRNKCIFCFIDQMPPKLRSTLYIKDDDWRFSLMMGNYITLTNVNEQEFERIIKRHASPLYVSVHSTDPALRRKMMSNKTAGDIMPRLQRLKDAGIKFHCQIVCCPGINDGEHLMQTLQDLASLAPSALSVAVVPVGITKFRQGLAEITPFNAESSAALLRQLESFQTKCRETLGTAFAFPSDEFFCMSGLPIPSAQWYEDYPQIENGVGLLRQLQQQLQEAMEDDDSSSPVQPRHILMATGVAAAPYMQQFAAAYAPDTVTVHVVTIINHFFGETVTVAGLLTGADTLSQLTPEVLDGMDQLFISANMLRHDQKVFLDGMTLDDFKASLPLPIRIVGDGYDLYNALRNR